MVLRGTMARRRAGQEKSTWVAGCRARRTVAGRAEVRGLQAAGGVGWRGRHRKEVVMDRRKGDIEKGPSEGTRRVKRWRGQCQQW